MPLVRRAQNGKIGLSRHIRVVENATVRRVAFGECETARNALIGRKTMKSPDMTQESSDIKPDLVDRSYSPALRALVVGVIFIVAIFLLAACGSKNKTATPSSSTPTQSVAISPSASPSIQYPLTCKADTSSDSLNLGKYFDNIMNQVRKDWRADAVISSARFDARSAKDFSGLCTLKTDSNWTIIFYSLSTKVEQWVDLDNSVKDSQGVPRLLYSVLRSDPGFGSQTAVGMSIADIEAQGKWKFDEYPFPEKYQSELRHPANFFFNWKMTMSQVVQKFIDRVKDEKITSGGFFIDLEKSGFSDTPFVEIDWVNGAKSTAYTVEPVSLKVYTSTH